MESDARYPVDEADYEEVAPNASAMIESMRAYGYSLPTAIADLVDNSIAAACKTVWLTFHWAGADSWISVADDGSGMTEAELRDAMRLGSRNPLHEREPTDLGRFGLGLKTASLSQCRRLTVASVPEGPAAVRRWDLDHLSRQNTHGWQLLKSAAPGSETILELPEGVEQGTVVLWEALDRIVGDADVADQRIQRHFLRAVEDVEKHLAMVFHRYLGGRARLRILVNGNEVQAWDPFIEGHPATWPTPEEVLELPGYDEPVRVRGFVLPHKDKLGDEGHQQASGPAGWNAQQGFYLYRNERLIVAGSWLGLGGSRPWTKEEHYKLARIRLDIPNSMDHLWQLDVKKSSAKPPPQILDRLKGLAQSVRQDARSVFAHRGKYRTRSRKDEFRRPWKAQRRSGRMRYQIDRQHPLVEAVTQSCLEQAVEVECMLRTLVETVPVEQIWLDAAENPDRTTRPFHGTTSRQLRFHIESVYRTIRRSRGCDHQAALALLYECEEYADEEARSIIAALDEGGD